MIGAHSTTLAVTLRFSEVPYLAVKMQSFSFKQYTQVDLVLAFINLYTQQSKSYFAGYQKY